MIKINLQSITNPKWSKNHNYTIPAKTNNLIKEQPRKLKRIVKIKFGKK